MEKFLKKAAFYGLVLSSTALYVVAKVSELAADKLSDSAEDIDREEGITEELFRD